MVSTKGKSITRIIVILLLLGMTGAFGWTYFKYQAASSQVKLLTDPKAQEQVAKEETAKIITQVSALIMVPTDEQPLIATVLDAASLAKEQPFYADAKNGDRLVIYSTKAILFDPKENKLVNVGPVSIQGDLIKKIYTLDVRNGSTTAGAAKTLADSLTAKGYTVAATLNAANTNYKGTTLVNMKGKDLKNLETVLGTKSLSALPAGEAPSTADAVVIVGN